MHREVALDGKVSVGHDLLQLLTSAMYTDPMILYREYIQNAVDAIDAAVSRNHMPSQTGTATVDIDSLSRIIRIRDNGIGIENGEFFSRLSSIGASTKRHNPFRGFRGIGRLVGLAYCRELVFRSRSSCDEAVLVGRWDCIQLRSLLTSRESLEITEVVRRVFSVSKEDTGPNDLDFPGHFFEVELRGVVRLGDDRLVNADAVSAFLSQVAPVPFSSRFSHGAEITERLRIHFDLPTIAITVNGARSPLCRPFQDELEISRGRTSRVGAVEFIQVQAYDSGLAALGWIVHHDYIGALPPNLGVRGIRARHGNLQIGDESVLDSAFVEPRFNKWCIGELHVFDSRLVPNGRRDAFEPNLHLDNLTGQLLPVTRRISKLCRQLSAERNGSKKASRLARSVESEIAALDTRLGSRVARVLLRQLEDSQPGVEDTVEAKSREMHAIRKKLSESARRTVRLSARDRGRLDALESMLQLNLSPAEVLRVARRLESAD